MHTRKRLYRSGEHRTISGVASGLADYFGVSIPLVRIVFLASIFLGGVGIVAYLCLWAITPKNPDLFIRIDESGEIEQEPSRIVALFKVIAMMLLAGIVVEVLFEDMLLDEMTNVLFVIGLAVGLYFLWRNRSRIVDGMGSGGRLYRSATSKKISGVFGGLAERWDVDPTILRASGVMLTFLGLGTIIPLYFLYALLVPIQRPELERIVVA